MGEERDVGAARATAATAAAAVEIRGLRMSFGDHEVLRGVDLTVARGEVVALLGPNGAGKTTMIEIVEGFRLPSAGYVRVLGAEPSRGDETWRAGVGVVLQSWRDHGKWRVGQLLDHLGRYYLPYATARRPRPWPTGELLDLVGLTGQAGQRVSTLSGGQRRRLDLAIGLVGRPEMLCLDEPTAGFDPQARRDFIDVVHRLSDFEDTAVLLTTHDLDEAEKVADRILLLVDGHIVADGSTDELTRRMAGKTQIRWTVAGEAFVHATDDATGFVRALFAEHGAAVADLEVRRPTLEEVYMSLVRRHEAGSPAGPHRPVGVV
jgi:ABC-2 type transport system ATP-binding protein